MSIYLGKIVALFAPPLGWVPLAGVVALGLLAAQWRRAAGGVIAVQLVVLWVCAMPWLDQRLTGWLEAEFPPVALETKPTTAGREGVNGPPRTPPRSGELLRWKPWLGCNNIVITIRVT